jgi:hypothetical protein
VASAEAVGASRMAAKEGQYSFAISREKGMFRHISHKFTKKRVYKKSYNTVKLFNLQHR